MALCIIRGLLWATLSSSSIRVFENRHYINIHKHSLSLTMQTLVVFTPEGNINGIVHKVRSPHGYVKVKVETESSVRDCGEVASSWR